jgi:hypothetical protein
MSETHRESDYLVVRMSETHRESDYLVEEHDRRHVEVEHEVLKQGNSRDTILHGYFKLLETFFIYRKIWKGRGPKYGIYEEGGPL